MKKPFALIVEDNPDIVALFQHVLDLAGYNTEIVMDGLRAMEWISAFRPDIVLLDLQLPGMTGVEILKQMRTDVKLSTIPVVVITAYSNYSDHLPFQPDLLLLKPVNIEQLSSLVQRLQATHGARSDLAHDPITGLFTASVFTERLSSSLEHLKQEPMIRFGILFGDLMKMEQIRNRLVGPPLNTFLHRLADRFKSTLRRTDTIAWSAGEATLLALIEELPTPEVTLKIAERVQEALNKHLENQVQGLDLRAICGVLICDSEYESIQKIMEDVSNAQRLLQNGKYTSPAVFDHKVVLTNK
jgi:PleD family two-component response regulator